MYKASIVIPAYNRKYHLKNTLQALNYQEGVEREDFEVIVVDDGSTDNTRDYLEGINKNFDLKYIYLKKGDVPCYSRARNTGWKNALAEIIIFLDSDMIIKRNYVKETLKCFGMDTDIVLISTRLLLPEGVGVLEGEIADGSIFERYSYDKEKKDLFEIRHVTFNQMSYNMSMDWTTWLFVFSCSIACTKKSLAVMDGFDENFSGWGMEDIDFGYRAYLHCLKVVYDHRLEGLHQYHKESDRHNYKSNVQYFLNRHPELKTSLPAYMLEDMLHYSETPEKEMVIKALEPCKADRRERPKEADLRVLPVGDPKDVPDVKEQVCKLLDEEGIYIVVLDFEENSDLYIWIQLVTFKRKCKVLYFPMSRKFDMQEEGGDHS